MPDSTPRPFTPTQERLFEPLLKALSVLNVWLFRASGGRLGGQFRGSIPILLLTTVGLRSGRRRTAPLLYYKDGEELVVVASKGGMSRHPLWYGNLQANPDVEVEVQGEKRKMVARPATSDEKAALWPQLVAMYPDYELYQARTERDIPVIILARPPESSP